MKTALISDIHANLAALEAVIKHIRSQGDIDSIICLGDVVGYGPYPEECIDLIMKECDACLMGNHDYALINSAVGFNPVAAECIECTRRQMEPGLLSSQEKQRRWDFIQNLPERMMLGADLLVHASPRDNIFEYILPRDPLANPDKITSILNMIDRRVYVGHTHKPGIFTEKMRFFSPEQINFEYSFSGNEKAIVNVSSLGQPRDNDPRACYAVVTDSSVRWHRVEYNISKTTDAIYANPCLNDRCGARLLEGR